MGRRQVLIGLFILLFCATASAGDIEFYRFETEYGSSIDDTEMTAEDFGDFTCDGNEDGCTVTDFTLTSEAAGDVIYFNGTNWVRLAGSGTDTWVLAYNTTTNVPYWKADADSGGATAWDDITDPDADDTITLAGYEIGFTSTLDEAAHSVFTIANTDADLTAETFLFTLKYTDDGQANAVFMQCIDNTGVTPNQVFKLGADGAITSLGTIEGATITEGGNDVYNSSETPGGELGGTWASPTIDDSVAVTSWNLTTPTITTSLTTSTPTTLSAAELDRLDGLTSAIIDDDKIDTFSELDTIVTDKGLVNKADGAVWLGTHDFGGATVEIPNGTADVVLANAGEVNLNTTDEQLSFHSAADGEISGEASISLLRHLTATFDPAGWYDQESTYRVVPLMWVGDDAPEGFTITEWKVNYVAGDPTTELDMDLCCDTTPDFNPAAGMTVMDIMDSSAGASSADTGFDSATCANGARMYLRLGADPTDANVVIAVDIWGYNEED